MPLRATVVLYDRSATYTLPLQLIREIQTALLDRPQVEAPVGCARRENDGVYQGVGDGEPLCVFLTVPSDCKPASWCARTWLSLDTGELE